MVKSWLLLRQASRSRRGFSMNCLLIHNYIPWQSNLDSYCITTLCLMGASHGTTSPLHMPPCGLCLLSSPEQFISLTQSAAPSRHSFAARLFTRIPSHLKGQNIQDSILSLAPFHPTQLIEAQNKPSHLLIGAHQWLNRERPSCSS
jgi:hypothetical protein